MTSYVLSRSRSEASFHFFWAMIFLDEKSGEMSVSAIDSEIKNKFSLTDEEVNTFNTEKEELAMIINDIASDATSKDEAKVLWDEYKKDIPVTASVFEKLK
jgi:hypothetical protein